MTRLVYGGLFGDIKDLEEDRLEVLKELEQQYADWEAGYEKAKRKR